MFLPKYSEWSSKSRDSPEFPETGWLMPPSSYPEKSPSVTVFGNNYTNVIFYAIIFVLI